MKTNIKPGFLLLDFCSNNTSRKFELLFYGFLGLISVKLLILLNCLYGSFYRINRHVLFENGSL